MMRLMEGVGDIVKCPICYMEYNEGILPFLLPCGHTVCSGCFARIKRESLEDYENDYKDEKEDEDRSEKEFDISLISRDGKKSKESDDSEEEDNDREDEDNDNEDGNGIFSLGCNEDNNSSDNKKENSIVNDDGNDDDDDDDNNDDSDSDSDSDDDIDDERSNNSNDESHDYFNNYIITQEDKAKDYKNKKTYTKFKFKCPFCLKRQKIVQEDVIINQTILSLLSRISKDIPNEKTIFCLLCQQTDKETIHLSNHPSYHKDHFLELTNDSFSQFKSFYTPIPHSISQQAKEEDQSISESLTSFLSQFLDNLFSSISIKAVVISNFYENILNISKIFHIRNICNTKLKALIEKYKSLITEYQSKEKDNIKNSTIKMIKNCHIKACQLFHNIKTILYCNINGYQQLNTVKSPSFIHQIKYIFNRNITDSLLQGYFHSILHNLFYTENSYSLTKYKKKKQVFLYNCIIQCYDKIYDIYDTKDKVLPNWILINRDGTMIYLLGEYQSKSNQLQSYNISTKSFKTLAEIPMKFYSFDSLFHKQYIFVFGGEIASGSPTNKCYGYNIEQDKWITLPNLNYTKSRKAVCIINGRFYAFGGKGKEISLTYHFETIDIDMEKIDSEAMKNKWSSFKVEDYYEPIYKFGFGFMNEHTLIIIGGENRTLEDYDLKGYVIDLKSRKLKEAFDINNIFISEYGPMNFMMGDILIESFSAYMTDEFNVWNQLNKIKTIIE